MKNGLECLDCVPRQDLEKCGTLRHNESTARVRVDPQLPVDIAQFGWSGGVEPAFLCGVRRMRAEGRWLIVEDWQWVDAAALPELELVEAFALQLCIGEAEGPLLFGLCGGSVGPKSVKRACSSP